MQPLERGFDVTEETLVPFEVGPMEFAHPVAVIVEGAQRNVSLGHAIDEGVDGLLVVLGGERGGQPQAIAPCGNIGGASDQCGVTVENLLRRRTVDHTEVDGLPRYRELYGLGIFGADFERHMPAIIHQHTVSVGGHVERNVLVPLFGGGAAVFVPNVDGLAVLHICTEPFAKAIDVLSHSKTELNRREYVGFIVCGAVHGHTEFTDRLGGHVGQAVQCETSQGLARRLGELLAVPAEKGQIPGGAFDHFCRQSTRRERNARAILAHFAVTVAFGRRSYIIPIACIVSVQRESRIFGRSLPVTGDHTNHTFRRGSDIDVECGKIQRIVTSVDYGSRRQHIQTFLVFADVQLICLSRVQCVDAVSNHPVSIGELHCRYS